MKSENKRIITRFRCVNEERENEFWKTDWKWM